MNLKQFPRRLDSKTSSLRITVPENLDLALEGLIRKVLREQPRTDDIYSFAANYFETLLKIRDKAGANYTPGQLCPFHNDEDAHEMIKIAGTFKKPEKFGERKDQLSRNGTKKGVENQPKKDLRRPKPKRTVKDEKIVKQKTPDLIKKLRKGPENRLEAAKTSLSGRKAETIEEKVEIEGEFLTSDPIKELVEKELMMEAKGSKKEPAAADRVLESSEMDFKKENKLEKFKADEKSEIKELVFEENEGKPNNLDEEVKTGSAERNTEETIKETPEIKKDILVNPEEIKETPTEVTKESVEETAHITTESHQPTTDQIQAKHPEKKEESEIPTGNAISDVSKSKEVPTKGVELPKKLPKQEEIQNVTGEQQQIDKETKATDENLVELPAGNYYFVSNSPDATATGTKKNEEKVELIVKNQQREETVNKDEIAEDQREYNARHTSQDDGTAEVKETHAETENKYENKKKTPESIEDDEIGLKTPEDGIADVENKTNEQKEEFEEGEQNQKTESSNQDDAKPIESIKFKEEETHQRQANPEPTTPEATPINREKTSPKTGQENINELESEMGNRDMSPNEQKLKEELQPIENQAEKAPVHRKEMERKDEAETQKGEGIPSEVDKKTELDEIRVQNFVEKAETEGEEEITSQEELCTVVDVKSIPKEDTLDEKQSKPKETESENNKEKIQITEDDTSRENLSMLMNVNGGPKEGTRDEKQTEKNENEVKSDKKTNPNVLNAVEDVDSIPENEEKEEKAQNKEKATLDEVCTVGDMQNILKEPKASENKPKETANVAVEADKAEKKDLEELPKAEGVKSIPKKETIETDARTTAKNEENDELCSVEDIINTPKENEISENKTEKPEKEILEQDIDQVVIGNTNAEVLHTEVVDAENKSEAVEIKPPNILESEKLQNSDVVQPTEEVQIKKIQTHYYDRLQVPETVTKEYIFHNVATPKVDNLPGVTHSLEQNIKQTIHENMNVPPLTEFIKNINGSLQTEKQIQTDTANVHEVESNTQISDSDDLLDITTPTSGYSLNLSEISLQTVSGMFLDSERKYSSLEIEEVRYTTPKSEGDNQKEVEEVILKKVIPTGVSAVPVPPRDIEEINSEEVSSESVKEKKEEKPEGESEGSRSDDSDVPFISVEVKTVIETQILDEEEEKDDELRRPDVEVTVEATIDIQDNVETSQSEPDSIEEESKISNGKSQKITDLKPNLEELQSISQEDQRKESSSFEQTGKESSSVESSSTISSAATEIKRADSAKRNFSSTRSLLSTQSLDLGKKNPLLKTRSLSTFRHGVTDFEVWNTIEKELEEAATKIQSKFRGYKTRKKLQRENAVHITTEESSPSTTPAEAEVKEEGQQGTGEFHDSIVLAEHPR